MNSDSPSIKSLLAELLEVIRCRAPEQEWLFNIFAQEAMVGRQWLDQEILGLSPGADILEVGAGLMILSCQLVREGFRVTALEPMGEGFSSFNELQKVIREYAEQTGCMPRILEFRAEDLSHQGMYDFAFSINVMEHVDDVAVTITNVIESLRPGRAYRFSCGNYKFPYEHHFGIPIIWNKAVTGKLFRRKIASATRVGDPAGLWRSLNWISVPMLRWIARDQGLSLAFGRSYFSTMLRRFVEDPYFSARRPRWMRFTVRLIMLSGFDLLLIRFPADYHPLIDCSITRKHPADTRTTEKAGGRLSLLGAPKAHF